MFSTMVVALYNVQYMCICMFSHRISKSKVWRTKPSRLTEGDHQVLSKVCVKDPPSPGVKILLDVVRLLAKEQGIFGPILPKLKDVRQSISLSTPCSFGSNALIQYGWRRPFLWPEVDHFDVFISHTWETNGRWTRGCRGKQNCKANQGGDSRRFAITVDFSGSLRV